MRSLAERVTTMVTLAALLVGCEFDTGGVGEVLAPPGSPADLSLDGAGEAPLVLVDASSADVAQPTDAGRPTDAAPADVTPADVTPADATPVDDMTVDATPVDDMTAADIGPAPDQAPPPDLAPPDLTPPPACDALFGKLPGYELCAETTTSCRFYVALGGKTCAQACGVGPGGCLDAKDNASGSKCTLEQPNSCGGAPCTCASAMNDIICTCAR